MFSDRIRTARYFPTFFFSQTFQPHNIPKIIMAVVRYLQTTKTDATYPSCHYKYKRFCLKRTVLLKKNSLLCGQFINATAGHVRWLPGGWAVEQYTLWMQTVQRGKWRIRGSISTNGNDPTRLYAQLIDMFFDTRFVYGGI